MTKRIVSQYKGRLTTAQIVEGMNLAMENGRRLHSAACLLLEKEDFSLAASLAVLSIEESGKACVLRGLSTAKNDEEVAACWREYRSHTSKNIHWIAPCLMANGKMSLSELLPAIADPESDHSDMLEEAKQFGLYTDCVSKGRWWFPKLSKKVATGLIETARVLLAGEPETEAELKSWMKHLGGVWLRKGTIKVGDIEALRAGLINYFKEARSTGKLRTIFPTDEEVTKEIDAIMIALFKPRQGRSMGTSSKHSKEQEKRGA